MKISSYTVYFLLMYSLNSKVLKCDLYTMVMLSRAAGSNGRACPVVILGPLKEDVGAMLIKEFPNEFGGCVPRE